MRRGSRNFGYSRLALHHLPDFWKVNALRRMYGMLVAGGVARLCDVAYNFEPDNAAECIEAWCASGRDVPTGTPLHWGRWELAEHVRDEYSTYSWLLEAMFERVGFAVEQIDKPDAVTANYVLRKS